MVLVSVCMLVYQQKDTIADAINSVLMQKTEFEYEILIGDDASTDGTQDIIREYCKKEPERCFLIKQEKNGGPTKNARDLIRHARGRYIAFLEGDDCWTDQEKLQMQIEFLQKNPDYSLVYHACKMVDMEGNILKQLEQKEELATLKELFPRGNRYMATSSMVGRNLYAEHPDWIKYLTYTHYIGDIPIKAAYLKSGKIGYINRVMSLYRKETQKGTSYSAMDLNVQRLDEMRAYRAVRHMYQGKKCESVNIMQMRVIRDIIEDWCQKKQKKKILKLFFGEMTMYEKLRYCKWRLLKEG